MDRDRRRAAWLSLVVGVALLAVKYVAYRWTGSAAVLSDALESIVNVVAAAFAVRVLRFAAQPADRGHPFGHGKIEYFSAVFEGGLVSFAAVTVAWYAVDVLVRGPVVRELEAGLVLTGAAALVNAGLGAYLVRVGRRTRSIALVADGHHVLSDFWTSAGVVVGLLLVRATGRVWIDPVVALLVGVNLAVTGGRLVRRAAGALLDAEDPRFLGRLVDAMNVAVRPGIVRVHGLRAIRAGHTAHVEAHVIVPEFWEVARAHAEVDAFEARLVAAGRIEGTLTLHVDPCLRALCAVCALAECPVRAHAYRGRPPLTVDEAVLGDDAFWDYERTSPPPTGDRVAAGPRIG